MTEYIKLVVKQGKTF